MIQANGCEFKEGIPFEEMVSRQLSDDCPYAYYFRDIRCEFADGILTVRGRLPTFYLKQVLQARLGLLEDIDEIRNEVDVVNSAGLSSVRP